MIISFLDSVLVTGGAGYAGSVLVPKLLTNDIKSLQILMKTKVMRMRCE